LENKNPNGALLGEHYELDLNSESRNTPKLMDESGPKININQTKME
jgi:hypothetical protein